MDNKSKTLLIIILMLIVFSVAATYYRTIVVKDYKVFYDDYEETYTEDPEEIAEILSEF